MIEDFRVDYTAAGHAARAMMTPVASAASLPTAAPQADTNYG